jgi:hypothetical protein
MARLTTRVRFRFAAMDLKKLTEWGRKSASSAFILSVFPSVYGKSIAFA